jgi:ABC-type uncharacterized transport system auxiliary subunit
MKYAKRLLCLIALLLPGCFGSTTAEQRYYTMSLPNVAQEPTVHKGAELLLHEVDVSPVYNRPQIVYRISPQELQFFHQNNWADRPSRMMGQLLAQAFTRSGIFRNVVERIGEKPPTYVMDTSVQALEELEGGNQWFAHLAMTLRMTRFDDNRTVWQFSFDERRPLTDQNLGLVVRAMSEILSEQLAIALPEIDAVVSGKSVPPHVNSPEGVTPATGGELPAKSPNVTDVFDGTNGQHVNWRHTAQYQSDPTTVMAGQGAIFLPSLSLKPDREPPVTVLADGKRVAQGTMGRRIPVSPGQYQVEFGSGPVSQHLLREVTVVEGETTVVSPDWAALDVSVVNINFIPFLGTYEIIRMEDHEYIGIGYGVNEELGQETQVWVLQAGLHKIIQSGSTYRARTNFSTVRLLPGMAVPFTLVQDEVTRDFLGAGVAEPESGRTLASHWNLHSTFGGSVLLTSRDVGYSSAPAGNTFGIDVFSDNRAQFKADPHLWTTRLEIEEGQTLTPIIGPDNKPGSLFDGRLVSSKDRVYLNSVYIYQFLPWIGPYVRVGGETSLFNHYSYFSNPTAVVVQDPDGNTLATRSGPDGLGETQVQLAGSFAPIQLKQGAGANFRALHNVFADLDLRTGLGSRQYFANGQLVPADDPTTPAFELRQVRSTVLTGVEISALGQGRISRFVQLSTEFDMLLPFEGLGLTQLTWRNAIGLRLSSFASVTYTLNIVRQPNVNPLQPFATEQGVQLRFFFSPL